MFRWVILFCLLSASAFAQETTLKVTVVDDDSKLGLVGVVISLDATNATTTDLAGKGTLTAKPGRHLLAAFYVGYEKYADTILLKAGENNTIIHLQSSASQLALVVVSASKYAKRLDEETVSMNVLEPSLIQNTNSIQMDEALNYVPGVNVIDGQANIRGGSGYSYGAGSRVLVLVDGLPELSADASDVKWDYLPLEDLSQVEIIKGASSTLYGSSALNGVINVITDYPGSKPETEINFFQGIYQNPSQRNLVWWGDAQPYFSGGFFNHKQRFGQLDLVVGGNVYNEQSYFQGVYTERGRVNVKLRYRFKKVDGLSIGLNTNLMFEHTVSYFIWQNDSAGGYKPFGGPADSAGTSLTIEKETRYNIDPFITWVEKNGLSQSIKTRYFATDNITSDGQNSNALFQYIEYQIQYPFHFGLRVTSGLVANSSTVISELYGNHFGNNEAGYVQLDQKLFGKLSIVGGVRYETFRLDTAKGNSAPVFRSGANYELFKGNHIRASIGQAYRFPSIAEKYVMTNEGSVYVYPNPQVQAEKGYSAEVGMQQGFKVSSWVGYVDVAAFSQHINHYMEFTFGQWGNPSTEPDDGLGFKSINLDEARIDGTEATIFGKGKILGCPVNLMGGVTLIQPYDLRELKISDSTLAADHNLTSTQRDSIYNLRYLKYRYNTTFKFAADITYKIFNFGLDCQYNSFMINIDPYLNFIPGIYSYRQAHPDGDVIFDSHLGVNVNQNLKFAFVVKNLFNVLYTIRPALFGAPRNYAVQMTVKF